MINKKRKTVLINPLSTRIAPPDHEVKSSKRKGSTKKKKVERAAPELEVLQGPEIEITKVKKKSESDSVIREIFSAEATNSAVDIESKTKSQPLSSMDSAYAILAKESQTGVCLTKASTPQGRKKKVDTIINKWAWISVPAGLINVPVLDSAALMAIQVKMISEICPHYEIAFEKESTRAIISGLMSGTITATLAFEIKRLVLNNLPYLGNVLSAVTSPTLSFASTYSVGHLFVQHFENSGALHDFKYENIKDSFSVLFEKGRQIYGGETQQSITTASQEN
jgi:uncharacterized protein (DUF697 family)